MLVKIPRINKSVPKQTIFLLFMLGPFFSNVFLSANMVIYYLNLLLKVLFLIYLLLNYYQNYIKTRRMSFYSKLVFFHMMVLAVATIYNKGDLIKYFGYFCTSIGLTIMIEIYSKEAPKCFLEALTFVYRVNIYLNFFLLLIFPNGVTTTDVRSNFLGQDNLSVPIIISGMILFIYHTICIKKKITLLCIIDIIVCVCTLVLIWSATGIVGFIVAFLFFTLSKMIPKIINFKTGFLGAILLCITIVFLRSVKIFSGFIESFLGKELTFTGRTYIWEASINSIIQHPIFGYGIKNSQAVVYNFFTKDYRLAHNEYLQTLLNGGVIYFITFFTILITVGLKLDSNKDGNNNSPSRAITAGIIALLIMFITETYGQLFGLYVLMGLGYFGFENRISSNSRRQLNILHEGENTNKVIKCTHI